MLNSASPYSVKMSFDSTNDPRGFTYNMTLATSEGKTYYFYFSDPGNASGATIQAISDKYGNTILYQQTSRGWLITDTYGRKITVSASGIQVDAGEQHKNISYQMDTIKHNGINNGYYTFHTHTLTVSEYTGNGTSGEKRDTKYTMKYKQMRDYVNYYLGAKAMLPLVQRIDYPTHAWREYIYEDEATVPQFYDASDTNSFSGDYFYYRVTGEKLYESNALKRNFAYTYTGQWKPSSSNTISYEDDYKVFQTQETLSSGRIVTNKIHYDMVGRISKDETAYTSGGQPEHSQYKKYAYYNGSILDEGELTDKDMRRIRRSYLVNTQTYRDGTVMTSEDTAFIKGTRLPTMYRLGETETNYTYDATYHVPLTQTTKRLNNSDLKQENTLTADKKNIAQSRIYDGTTLQNTTDYTYNSDGSIASQTEHNTDGNITTVFTYQYRPDCSYTVSKTVSGVSDLEGNTTSVTTTTEYDSLGRQTKTIDANGNATTYEYNMLGQITKKTNPDGTSESVKYEIPLNRITVTDANGNSESKVYTPLGKPAYTYRNNKLTRRTKLYIHDDLDRLTREITYMDFNEKRNISKNYTYDDFDRPLTVTTKDGSNEISTQTNTYGVQADTIRGATISGSGSLTVNVSGYKRAEIMIENIFTNLNAALCEVSVYGDSNKIYEQDMFSHYAVTKVLDVSNVQLLEISASKGRCDVTVRLYNDTERYFAGANLTTTTTTTGDSYYTPPKTVTVSNAVGQTLTETSYAGNSSTVNNKSFYQYDYQGNVLQTKTGRVAMQSLASYSTKTEYNYLNLPVKEYVADGRNVTKTYDQLGRMLTQTDPMGNTTTYEYDKLGRVLRVTAPFDSTGTTETRNTYDNNGNVIKTQVKNSKPGEAVTYATTEYEYDSMNRVITAIAHNGAQRIYTQYAYDAVGNLLKTVTGQTEKLSDLNGTLPDSAAVTSYEYDEMGNVTKVTDALGQSVTTEYNVVGLPTKSTDRNGVVTTTSYNAYGSPTVIKTGSLTQTNTYNKNNLLVQATNGTDTISYAYDSLGRLTKETNGDIIKTYTNDADGNRTAFTLTNGGATEMSGTYTYDKTNRLTNVSYPGVVTSVYTYNANDALVKEVRDNLTVDYTYNNAGLMLSKSNTMADVLLEKYNYTYSYDGKQRQKDTFITEDYDGAGNRDTTLYVYDQLGQLISESNSKLSRQYTYDSRGNRTGMVADGVTTNYTYDKNNRLLHTDTNGAMVDYNYDNNGNLYSKLYSSIMPATGEAEGVSAELLEQPQLSAMNLAMEEQPLTSEELSAIMEQEPGKSVKEILAERRPAMLAAAKKEKTAEFFTYNERGQLIAYQSGSATATYTYGADGYRKTKTVNGKTTTHIWDGDQIVKELGANHGIYYRAGSAILAGDTGCSLGVCTYLTDGHGNVTQMTARGFEVAAPIEALLEDYRYDAYGNQSKGLAAENPFQYCGEYYDEETGMTYLRARYYDPSIGRFISEDPVKDGLNWYVYCANDPVNKIDPLGLFDYNTRLSYSQNYNEDVEVLQNELAWLGYMARPSDGDWGYFGPKTQDAVNRYKADRGLGNSGNDKGVVGLQTWTSLGLKYRTQNDINAGVKMVMVGGRTQYKDVSTPINNALVNARDTFSEHSGDFVWFKNQVNHEADWDIKRKDPWERTIGSTFPGSYDTKVVLFGTLTTPEELGNITYGYLGSAAGFNETILIAGSMYAAGIWTMITDDNARSAEYSDHPAIRQGINWYNRREQ